MLEMAKRFFGSTKAAVMIAALISLIGGWLSLDIPKEDQTKAAGAVAALGTVIVGVWIKAQGEADHGKEAKKLEIAAAAPPTPAPSDAVDGGADS